MFDKQLLNEKFVIIFHSYNLLFKNQTLEFWRLEVLSVIAKTKSFSTYSI